MPPVAAPPPGGPARLPLVPAALGVVALAALAGVVTWSLLDEGEGCAAAPGGSGCPPIPEPRDPDVASPVPSPASTEPSPTATAGPTPAPVPTEVTPTGATGTPFWTVIVASKSEAEGGRPAAERVGAVLAARGYPVEVFHTDWHDNLTPGLWVAATGRFATKASAAAEDDEVLRTTGVDGYARCVGADSECPD